MSKQDFFYWWTDILDEQNILNLDTYEKQLAVYCAHINCMRSENNSSQVEIESNGKKYILYFFYNKTIIYGYILDDNQRYELNISYKGKSQKPMFELCTKPNIILTDSEEEEEKKAKKKAKKKDSKAEDGNANTLNISQIPIGMVNTGNKCYNIAALQCLIHCVGDFISELSKTRIQGDGFINKFLNFSSQRKYDDKTMEDFYDKFNENSLIFKIDHEQQDSNEFIFFFFKIIENEILPDFVNKYKKDFTLYEQQEKIKAEKKLFDNLKLFLNSIPENPVKSFFNIYYVKKLIYSECNNKFKIIIESDIVLKLPLENTKEERNIKNLIAQYCQEEIQDDKCKIEAENCNGKIESECKSRELISEYLFPKILIIQLKLFKFNKKTKQSDKINCNLKINEKLEFFGRTPEDINNNINQKKSLNYSLSGIVCHTGTSERGHYISYINKNGIWYECNDNTITPMHNLKINSGFTPYILFYRRI